MSRTYQAGDHVLLVDRKKRRYLITLEEGGEFHSHTGVMLHDDLIGAPDGSGCRSSRGTTFVVCRPTLADYVSRCPGEPRSSTRRTWGPC